MASRECDPDLNPLGRRGELKITPPRSRRWLDLRRVIVWPDWRRQQFLMAQSMAARCPANKAHSGFCNLGQLVASFSSPFLTFPLLLSFLLSTLDVRLCLARSHLKSCSDERATHAREHERRRPNYALDARSSLVPIVHNRPKVVRRVRCRRAAGGARLLAATHYRGRRRSIEVVQPHVTTSTRQTFPPPPPVHLLLVVCKSRGGPSDRSAARFRLAALARPEWLPR